MSATAPGRARLAARRVFGWPARRVLDRRVEWILAALDARIGATGDVPRASVHDRLDLLERELRHATRALGESLLDRRLASLAADGATVVPGDATRGAPGVPGDTDQIAGVLPGDTARFLNWAEGAAGPAARAGLWFNAPVPVEYAENAVDVLLVNERIVEQPYVFGALASLPRGARVLDVGGAESTVALSLASLGYEVEVVDPRGCRLEHPGLRTHALSLEAMPHEKPFDAAVALSCIEHFGLGAYGARSGALRMDRAALASLCERLVAGGLLVLTVPLAAAYGEDDFQRVYSCAELREMLAGWDVTDFSAAWRRDRLTWLAGRPDDPLEEIGVALVSARRPA